MLKLLKQEWPDEALEGALAAAHLSPQVRAEAVSLEQFVIIARSLKDVAK